MNQEFNTQKDTGMGKAIIIMKVSYCKTNQKLCFFFSKQNSNQQPPCRPILSFFCVFECGHRFG